MCEQKWQQPNWMAVCDYNCDCDCTSNRTRTLCFLCWCDKLVAWSQWNNEPKTFQSFNHSSFGCMHFVFSMIVCHFLFVVLNCAFEWWEKYLFKKNAYGEFFAYGYFFLHTVTSKTRISSIYSHTSQCRANSFNNKGSTKCKFPPRKYWDNIIAFWFGNWIYFSSVTRTS